jgi:maltooligosyltrehalose trehalohydrolase
VAATASVARSAIIAPLEHGPAREDAVFMADDPLPFERRLGAFPLGDGNAGFRVWAPLPGRVALRVNGREHPLEAAGLGVYEAVVEAEPGADYEYLLDGTVLPDPCSRWQPDGLRGPSRLLDTAAFTWTDQDWAPPAVNELVLYELHVGTFSAEGTFEAAIPYLRGLRELGVTAIELMPVAEFPGRHGWGYDGVYLSAAQSSYGGPHGLQRLVDAAHREGLAVLLDVVYNHVGASGGQALRAFGPYFTSHYETPWGEAINYDAEHSDAVREWALQSAEQWIRDFHLDGLRLDAVHAIMDGSPEHLVAALARRTEPAFVIAESGMNDPKVMRDVMRGGWECDAAWADDFHHSLRVLLTGDHEGYYAEFGGLADLAKAFHRPHVHDGQYSAFRHRRFGAKADDVPPERFVVFSANHDQVGNRAFGDRLPPETRPLAALCTLLSPFTPMIFQGEEHGEIAPFQFFSDHIDDDIAAATREGRRREFAAFAAFSGREVPDPQDPATFEASKLTRTGQPDGLRELYAELLRARRDLPPGDADEIDFDEHAGWLRVRRGPYVLVAGFSRERVHVPLDGTAEPVVAAGHVTLEPGYVALGPLSGALVKLGSAP